VRSPHPRTKGLEEIDHGKEETCKESPEKKGQVTSMQQSFAETGAPIHRGAFSFSFLSVAVSATV
jgi:hypothetical protein